MTKKSDAEAVQAFQETRMRTFNRAWRTACKAGGCDSLGGAEYRRVFSMYVLAGMPAKAALFISRWANMDASDRPVRA